jgi:hypothetical protein
MRLWPWKHAPKLEQDNQDYGQYDAYSKLLDRNGQWISVADTKAAAVLAFLVAGFPVFAVPALPIAQKLIKAVPHKANIWVYLPAIGFMALLGMFLVTAFLTLHQVLMTLVPRLTRQTPPGLIFFGDIASLEYKQWQQRILVLDPQTLALQVLEQVYVTAYIAAIKHKYVGQAIRTLVVTILLGIALYALCNLIG